jgi:ParB family chromosome partitioning protein
MTKKKSAPKSASTKGLGKGLSALLGDNAAIASMSPSPANQPKAGRKGGAEAAQGAQTVPIDLISANPYQPRINFDEASLKDLADSLAQHGVVQPLLVRPKGKGYELIAGERRWRAAQKAGLHDVPVVVREADDKMAAEIAMVENIQRSDLSVMEEAEGYRRLIEEFNYSQDALAKIIGKSRSHLANTMRLLNLPDAVRHLLHDGHLTAGQVRPLIGRDDAGELAKTVRARGMSARQVEALVAKQNKKSAPKVKKTPNITALERSLAAATGLDIDISYDDVRDKGVVTIKVKSLGQFDAIIAKLKRK